MAWKKQGKDPGRAAEAAAEGTAGSGTAGTRSGNGSRPVHLGEKVTIDGNVTVDGDLNLEGTVNGRIALGDHVLTVGRLGRVTDDVEAKTVIVAGSVCGNVEAKDRVEIVGAGSVRGDIRASRVVLSEGARFSGCINRTAAGEAESAA